MHSCAKKNAKLTHPEGNAVNCKSLAMNKLTKGALSAKLNVCVILNISSVWVCRHFFYARYFDAVLFVWICLFGQVFEETYVFIVFPDLFSYYFLSRATIRVLLSPSTLLNWRYPITIHFTETYFDMQNSWSGLRTQIMENMKG